MRWLNISVADQKVSKLLLIFKRGFIIFFAIVCVTVCLGGFDGAVKSVKRLARQTGVEGTLRRLLR